MAAVNLIGSYNYALVALSVLIAMFASYAALDLAGRVTAASGWARAVWLLGGAAAMGTGIWSMHYIGMLAFILPIPVAYHWPTVLLSLFAAIAASVIALYVVSRQKMGTSRAVAGSVLMGAGIASMHYIGMDAMRLPAICRSDSSLVGLSVVLAVLISFAALWITFHFRDGKTGIGWQKLAGAVVMGAAIPVMHYTGMAAASFTSSDMPADLSHAVSVSTLGTAGIAAVTFIVLGLALLTSWMDRRFAAQTLELERKHWRSLTEALPQLVWAATPDGATDYFSTQWTEYTGVPEAGLFGWRWMEVLHPDDRENTRQVWGDSVAGRRPYDVEYRVRRHDGAYGWFKTRGTPIRDSEGRITKWFGTCTDITDRKRAEEALHHSEQALRRARDELEVKVAERTAELQRSKAYLAEAQTLSRTGSFGWRVSSGEIFWSEETFRIFGYDRTTEPTVERVLQRVHPQDAAFVKQTIERASQDGRDFEHEYRLVMPDGLVKHVHVVARALSDASGELEFVGSVMDITERKRKEAELLHNTALLDELFEGSPDAVVLMDLEARVLRISREFAALFGYAAEEANGRSIVDLIVPEDELEDSRAGFARVQSGERFVVERERRRKDGTRIQVSIKRAPIVLGGKPIGYYGIYRDVTQRKRAEEALRLSEERYALAVQASGEGHWDWNIESDEFYASPRYLEIGGFPPDFQSLRREDVMDRIPFHPEDRPKYDAAVAAHFAGATPRVDIVIRITPHAETRWLHVIGMCLRDASGKPVRWAGSVSDVTARMRAEEALRLSEERYALAMLAAEDAHWDWIVGTDQYYLSPRTLDLFGLPPDTVFTSREDYLARTPLVREDLEKWQRAIAELFAGSGSRLSMELRAVVRGEIRWLQHIGVCVRDASGQPVRWAGTARDITERRRTDEALQRSETYLAEGQKLSRTGSWAWSAQTKQLTHWSEEQYRMLGFDSQAGMPSDEAILARIHPGDHGRYIDDLKTAVRERSELETHYRVCLPDATVKYVHVVGHPVFNAAGDLVEYVGSSMDVTEREQAEEALREQGRRLRQAEKMEAVGRLAGGIAHDFNNILGAILGYGELAQKGLEGRAARRHVDQVMQAGARGKELVERILAFSRSGLGERVPVHVQSVVEEALEILAASLAADVRLEQRLDAGDTAVVGDATQLHQVAMNLCTNALQAMEHGGLLTVVLDRAAVPERRALSHGTLAAGPYVRLAVSDTGSGIPSAVLERMFDPFFTTKGVGEGTGLGLSLVHGIVADFGGAIDVTTQAGAGTTFTVWLPAAGETTRALTEPAGDLPQGNGETIMIVDDQSSLVALAEETLAALGYEPAGFRSSVAALRAFRAEPQRYDLVLTDETMPDMSGVDLACEMRRVRPELPIVLMSGYSGAQLTERAHAAGVTELLRKPLVRRDIAHALGRALRPS